MRRSLATRLAGQLTAILVAVGAIFTVGSIASTRHYWNEVQQELHLELADHLVEESLPLVDGEVDEAAIEHIFHMLMVINPTIEVYLLNPSGTILAFAAPKGAVVETEVDLDPVLEFLSDGRRLPIFGDDPRGSGRRKVFSAARLGEPDALDGYLYVVLGGQQYDTALGMIGASHRLRLALGGAAAAILFASLAGWLLFRQTTRRLTTLSEAVQGFRASGFTEFEGSSWTPRRDELDDLSATVGEMAERLKAQLDELEKTDALRRELVANVSHDLRTPLTLLRGYLDTIMVKAEELEPSEQRRLLEQALQHCGRLGDLVKELFELARLESGTVELQPERIPLGELVQDSLQEFQLRAEDKAVVLSADLPEGSTAAFVDVSLMARVLENLIDNGLRHTPEGGRVRVRLEKEADGYRVTVEDTGPGVAPKDRQRVFDRFIARPDDGGGTGLGLSIARRIVELHGGSIGVEGAAGSGAIFSFTVPPGVAPGSTAPVMQM